MIPLFHDARYAARMLVKSPGFAAVATLTLALGIGANTAIFSVVHALVLRPLPYADADRIVMVWQDLRARGGPADEWATPGNFVDWRDTRTIFAHTAAVQGWRPTLTGVAEPEPLVGEQVTLEYFDVVRVLPSLGRTFLPEEDVPNAPRVALLGHGLWQRRFGGDPAIIGRVITLGGEAHEVVGVMPAGFRPVVASGAEVWRPRRLDTANPSRGAVVLRVVARLPSGVTLDQARTAAAGLARQLEQTHPDTNEGAGINIVSLHDQVVGEIRPGLLVLLGAVGFVLLIACVNIANLLLARASGRGREVAVRMALGAMRRRIVGQLLTESVLLAAIGGALGLLFGVWGVAALVAIAPEGAPRVAEIRLDRVVLAFTAGLSLITGLVFGLVPALQASRADLLPALRDGARGTAGGGGRQARRALIIVEIAVALVLLAGSGLLVRSFQQLQAVDLGFNPSNVLVGYVAPPPVKYPTAEHLVAFYDRLLDRVAALHGVETASLSSVIPLGGDSDMTVLAEGRPVPRTSAEALAAWYRLASAEYLDAMGIRLREGRNFSRGEAPPVVVVSETAARTLWPGESAIGRRVRFSPPEDDAPWFTVIGIAEDVKMRGARGESRMELYLPYWQFPERGINIVLRTAGDPALLAAPLGRAVREVDPDIPVSGLAPMRDLVRESVSEPRFFALLSGVFALLALTLAAIGIYGVISYGVAQRTPEIGVRMALGAGRREVFRLILGDSLRLAAAGIALGLVAALALGRGMRALLFGVESADPVTFVATTAVLLMVALVATIIPARRATRVDPMTALRAE